MDSLNTFRMILVGCAVVAAIITAVNGYWLATTILGIGILVHGGATVWLHRTGQLRGAEDGSRPAGLS